VYRSLYLVVDRYGTIAGQLAGFGRGPALDVIAGWIQRASRTSQVFSMNGRHETGADRDQATGLVARGV
jgi:hypothetical protein